MIYIIDLESLDNRYTKQWKTHIPALFDEAFGQENVMIISGDDDIYDKPKTGSFFDFNSTCEYKSTQSAALSRLFQTNTVQHGDIFFFTDAWNPTVHYLKYMSELSDIEIFIAGIWHAGYYDPTDILGFTIRSKDWIEHLEQSMYHAYDINFFGTQQHLNKFNLKYPRCEKYMAKVCGYPFDYIAELKNNHSKENLVLFPHRLNSDKNPWFFDILEKEIRKIRDDIHFIKTQSLNLDKEGYYELLKKGKVVFSCSEHENLGIGVFEAMTAGCLPIVPNKLSYEEMYSDIFKYEVNSKVNTYLLELIEPLVDKIIYFIDNYNEIVNNEWVTDVERIQKQFFNGTEMIKIIKENFIYEE